MTSDILLRPARSEDVRLLAVLAMQVWLHTYATDGVSDEIAGYVLAEFTPTKYEALLNDPAVHMTVATRGVVLVGFAVLRHNQPCPVEGGPTSELQTLYVQAHFMGQGVGSALLQAAQSQARAGARSAVWLSVNAQNARAIAFYARHGYTKIGTSAFMLGNAEHENHVLAAGDT